MDYKMHIFSYLAFLKSEYLLQAMAGSQFLEVRQQFDIIAIVCTCVALTMAVPIVIASIGL
jgi:hypothetical protein